MAFGSESAPPPLVCLFLSGICLVLLALPTSLGTKNRPASLEHPQPTQFEVALLQTLEGVRQGTLPDPALRKADGTPGTLLDLVLSREEPTEDQRASARRQLAATWRLMGAGVPFSQGPTLSAYNQSYYRYTSVFTNSVVDWRATAYVTPIQVQYNCASCWLVAAADTVAMASAIASGKAASPAGVQQACDCSSMTCCQGGWPEAAYSWMTAQGNITTGAAYAYWAQDNRTCTLGNNYPIAGNVTGFERVPTFSQTALMKAVSMQPVLVYISAASADFQGYSSTAPGTPGFKVYDGNCSTEVNHAVVLVGYNTQANPPYWVVKNSWPSWGWGHNGYMYLAMTGDGAGKCGIQTVSPLFPVNFPSAPSQLTVSSSNPSDVVVYNDDFWWNWWQPTSDPCKGVINPCGSGQCLNSTYIARCSCPTGYVEVVGVPTSKCVDSSPCTSSLFNPCGAGSCMDVGDGSYVCGCPTGYVLGSQVNGAPACVPVTDLSSKPSSYVAQYGDSCNTLQSTYSISSTTLTALNPGLNCNKKYLAPGTVITLGQVQTLSNCTAQYAVRPKDNCSLIAWHMDNNRNFSNWLTPSFWNATTQTPSLLYTLPALSANVPSSAWTYSTAKLQALNPTLKCSNLLQSQLVCVNATQALNTTAACGATYTTTKWDSCSSVRNSYSLSISQLSKLNPGLNCSGSNSNLPVGLQICVGAAAPATSSSTSSISSTSTISTSTSSTSTSTTATSTAVSNCSQYYTVQQGDSCAQIWNAANLSQFQFLYLNPGLQCQAPFLYVGQQVCINSLLLANIPDPSFVTYTVQPSDTLAYVQSAFASKCQSYSITFSRIAAQNGIADWTTWTLTAGSTIVIPCVPKVGATCGCIPSLTVCGGDFVNYPSYCDATCNFASPITTGSCSACQSACAGRYGTAPNPTSACASGYTCPYPTWPPSVTDASKVFTCTYSTGGQCLCQYRQQTCTSACALYANTVSGGSSSTCYNFCYHCALVPCGGPSVSCSATSSWCGGSCTSSGTNVPCNPSGRGCVTQCSYWNNWWLTNSGTTPAFYP